MRSGVERFALMALLILAVSCSASKQNGFSYRPAYSGPDVAGYTEAGNTAEDIKTLPAAPTSQPLALNQVEEDHLVAVELAAIVDQQINAQPSTEKVSAKKAVNDIAESFAEKNNIELTQKQWRKLDKYAAKLEKKQQKKADVEWGPKNNLEIFLLAAAGVGLVVGFFSAIGWFVFLVAALVYLYLKLLKD